jgi:hypothetical protein
MIDLAIYSELGSTIEQGLNRLQAAVSINALLRSLIDDGGHRWRTPNLGNGLVKGIMSGLKCSRAHALPIMCENDHV